jgi:hypothetical protein
MSNYSGKNQQEMPIYRNWWFLIVAFILFFPAVFLLLGTGGVYVIRDGVAVPIRRWQSLGVIILAIAFSLNFVRSVYLDFFA